MSTVLTNIEYAPTDTVQGTVAARAHPGHQFNFKTILKLLLTKRSQNIIAAADIWIPPKSIDGVRLSVLQQYHTSIGLLIT
jgi:hypothetical protein